MSANWYLGGTVLAELDWKMLQGRPGLGFYQLIMSIDVTTHGKQTGEEVTLTSIGGELKVRGKDNKMYFLGCPRRQDREFPLTTYPHMQKSNLTLGIELDAKRIEAIERIRMGGDLFFEMDLYGVAHSGREKNTQAVCDTLQYRANQSTWTEILEQMGYRRTILLEIPVPGDEISPEFSKATMNLQTAHVHMLRGHFRDAVGACRDVMESLTAALHDNGDQQPEAIQSWFEGTRSLGKEERLRIVRRALTVLTHAARHADQVSTSIEWGPTDARAAITMAAALLQLAAERT